MPLPSLSKQPDEARAQIGAALSRATAATLAICLALKTAHWLAKGPHFIALHKLFDELADAALSRSDTLAERCVGLGVPAQATPQFMAGQPGADFPAEFIDGLDAVRRVLVAYDAYAEALRLVRAVAAKYGDRETGKILDDIIADVEHDAFLLRPHIEVVAPKLPS